MFHYEFLSYFCCDVYFPRLNRFTDVSRAESVKLLALERVWQGRHALSPFPPLKCPRILKLMIRILLYCLSQSWACHNW